MKASGVIFLCIFGLFWTGIVGAFDVLMIRGYYQQFRALSYATTSGTVTHSEVTTHHSRKGGTTYGVKIQYAYEVGGQRFESAKYRYGMMNSSSGSSAAHEAVRSHPSGQPTTVYYDKSNPAESVLANDFRGNDLFMPLFLTPFNLVMFALWSAPVNWLWRKFRADAAGAKTFLHNHRLHVRLPRYSPLIAGAATTGIAAFASIFIVLIATGGNPGVMFMLGVWMLVLGGGAVVAFWQSRKQSSGRTDLIIDPDRQTIQLPATFDRKQPVTIAAAEVFEISVETIARRGSKGGTTYTYAVTLELNGGRREKLTEWMDKGRADRLASWLRGKIVVADPAAPPKKTKPPAV